MPRDPRMKLTLGALPLRDKKNPAAAMLSAASERLAVGIRGAKLVLFEDAGDNDMADKNLAALPVTLEFLTEPSATATSA